MMARSIDLPDGPDGVRVRVRTEQHEFRCECCDSRFSIYQIRDYLGSTGARWVVHCRDGEPVPAPHFGLVCPRCGRVSVTFDDDLESRATEPRLHTATR